MIFSRLIEELSDLPAAEFQRGIDLLIGRGSELLGASDALLSFGIRGEPTDAADPLAGWRAAPAFHRFGPNREADETILQQFYGWTENHHLDPTTVRLAETRGTPRALLHHEILDRRAWLLNPVSDLFDACGIGDRLSGGCPVAENVEALFVTYRRRGQLPFAEHEREVMRALMAAMRPFARRIAMSYGYVDGASTLTPRERETLRHLLTGLSEKEIAAAMNLRERSLHHHVTALYRKLRVRSRAELMARFLSGTSS